MFYTKIKFERTSTPVGTITFDRDPAIPNYARKTQYAQPKDFSNGGDPYIYNKGISPMKYRTLVFTDISVSMLSSFMTFLEDIAIGSINDFSFTDRDGSIYLNTRIWNSDSIVSIPQLANLEQLTIELLLGSLYVPITGDALTGDGEVLTGDGEVLTGDP